jgi:hypothetical protein
MDDYNKALLEAIVLQNETILRLELNILNISNTLASIHTSGYSRIDKKMREIIKTQMDEADKSLRTLNKDLKGINEKYKGDTDEN